MKQYDIEYGGGGGHFTTYKAYKRCCKCNEKIDTEEDKFYIKEPSKWKKIFSFATGTRLERQRWGWNG